MKQATTDHWIQACASAWKRLSYGRDGCFVVSGESWAQAIARVAARILTAEGYARKRGPVDPDWIEAAERFAARGSCAGDGLVEGQSGLRMGTKSIDARAARRVLLEKN